MPICGATSPIGDICQREPGHRGDHESFGPDVSSRWTNPATVPTPEPTPGIDEDGLTPLQQQVAKVLWNRWAADDIPAVRIVEDPRTVAQVLGPVLAAHDTQVRAEALREASGPLRAVILALVATGNDPSKAATWLEERADRIAKEAPHA